MTKIFVTAVAAMLAVACAAPALADAPTAGQWSVDSSLISNGVHWNTLGICLKSDGTWYTTQQKKGSGVWYQSGRNVYWHGNIETLDISATLTMTNANDMSGTLQQWVPGSTSPLPENNLYATTRFQMSPGPCGRPF